MSEPARVGPVLFFNGHAFEFTRSRTGTSLRISRFNLGHCLGRDVVRNK